MKIPDILTLILGLYATAYALVALFGILLIISFILLLFGMNIYNIAAFWALCIGLPLFWKYVHDQEEKEQKENRLKANQTLIRRKIPSIWLSLEQIVKQIHQL